MERRCLLAFGFLAFGLFGLSCAPPAEKTAAPSPLAGAAREFLDDAVDRELVAGAVALVSKGDELVFLGARGMADREGGVPMTTDTLFRIASMSKPITSVALMTLYDEGRFTLDDPVAKFIPDFADARVLRGDGSRDTTAATEAITIRHLLTHTSGLTYRFIGLEPLATLYEELGVSDGLVQTEGTIGEGVERLARAPLLHEPGSKWAYSLSTDVVGYLVEVISGQPLDRFLDERVFEPLGMTDTYFFIPDEEVARLSAVYAPGPGGGIVKLGEEPITQGHLVFSTSYQYSGPRTYFSGGAGLVSTVGDYYRLARMLSNGGELDGVRVLKDDTVALMTENQIGVLSLDEGTKFGLGFSIKTVADELGGVGTYGWGGFFHTLFWIDPENDIIGIFMTQLRPDEGVDVRADFARAVYAALSSS